MTPARVLTGIALSLSLGVVNAQTFSSSDGPISIGPLSTNGIYTPASRYPSQITVPGTVAGTVTTVSVNIKGLNADGNNGLTTQGLGILLVSPDGRQFELHRDTSDGGETLSNLTLNISDANSIFLPDQNTAWSVLTGSSPFKPTAYPDGTSPSNYPAPGPGAPAHSAAPAGGDTFTSVFTGAVAAGTWNLYVVDHLQNDFVSFTGWDLILTVAATQTSTTTSLNSATNPSFTSGANSSVTLTATVSSASAAPTGTVLFRDGVNTIAGCSASALSPSGSTTSTATCVTTFGTEGNHALSAVYSGAGTFAASTSATLNQFVKNHSSSTTLNQYCNAGPITAPGASNTFPYPSVINIGSDTPALATAVATLTVTLNGLAAPGGLGTVKAVLVGPGGSKSLVFLSDAGFSGGQPSVNLTFADTASAQVVQNSVLSSTSYQPTSFDSPSSLSSPPPPAPQIPLVLSIASPGGGSNAKTLTTAFNGQMPNGDWSLFFFDAGGSASNASISGGWCINVTPAVGVATVTNVGSSLNPAINGNPVAITATVTQAISHLPVPIGAVTFTENGLPVTGGPASPVTVDVTGTASFTTTGLSEGDHNIEATFSDSTNAFSLSFANIVQRVDRGTTGPVVSGSTLIFCNPNPITIPANSTTPLDIGAANPNPSNIFVSGLAGAISNVSVTFNNFSHPFPTQLSTLLVGPQDTNAAAFDFFSGGGGTAPFGPATIQLKDGFSLVPFSTPPAATNGPTSYTGSDTFTSSPSGFYTLPTGPYVYAAPAGGASFGSVFTNGNPNGTWSLYFNQTAHATGGGISGGWCLNIDVIHPVLSITKSHVGNFTQGQTGATYTITATNNGPGPTASAVTVSDALPTGLTATAISGSGWSCTQPSGPCSRTDALPMGSSYPALTLTVNVAGNATTPLVNQATVSGGGDPANHTASDSTVISPAADLTIAKSHTGNFTQGDIGDTYSITASNLGPGATTGTVSVVDTLPAGLTATAISGTGWTCVLGTLTCTRGDSLASGSSYPVITLTVNVANSAPASVTNTATVSGGGEQNTSNDSATDPTTITQVADLMISKSHAGNFRQGDTGDAYSIVVNNAGTGPTVGTVTVVDTLPAGLTATAIGGSGWTCTLATLTCTRTDALATNLSYPAITVTVNVANNAPATVTNSVTVSGGGELNTGNDSATDLTVITQAGDLTITKSHSGSFRQGDTGDTYTVTASNAGPGPTVGTVTVTDTLPTGLTATAIGGTGWTCVLGTLSCTRTDVLAVGSYPAITVTVNVANNAPATVTNTATVSGGGELNTGNDSASDPTTITQAADLTITKSHSASFRQGDTGDTYSITVSNAGPGATVGTVTVADTLPAGLTATAISGTGWTCVLGTLSCTRTDVLAVGSYPAITVTVNVASNAAASVTNTATVSGGGELNTANDTASDPTTIVQLVTVIVNTAPTGLSFSVDGVTYTTAQTFQYVQGSSHTIATTTPQTPSAGVQDLFLNWSDAGAISHSITAPTTATTYTANFQQQFLLTTAVTPAGGGTVTGGGFYNAGATATVTATASTGFAFISFTGTTSPATQNPGTVLMSAPTTVTANFLIPTTTVVSAASGVYSDPVTLTATVSPVHVGSQTLTGTVAFTVNGGNAGVVAVNASGVATVSYSVQLGAGPYTIAAQFVSGNPAFANSAGSNTLTVSKENANVTPNASNPTSVKVNSPGGTAGPIVLKAAITEVPDATLGDIANAQPVTCVLTPVLTGSTLTQTATTTGGGVGGTLTATCTFNSVPVNFYNVSYTVGGNFYTGSATGTLAIFDPTAGSVVGGGTLTHNGASGNFAMTASYAGNTPEATLSYSDIKGSTVHTVVGVHAVSLSVVGKAAVVVLQVLYDGQTGYTATLTVDDVALIGSGHDTYGMQLTGPSGIVTALTYAPVTITGDILIN